MAVIRIGPAAEVARNARILLKQVSGSGGPDGTRARDAEVTAQMRGRLDRMVRGISIFDCGEFLAHN